MLKPARWQEIQALFAELIDAEPETRAARLDQLGPADAGVRRAVEGLLASDARGDDQVGHAIGAAADALLEHHLDRIIGTDVGPYRVVSILGHGGMSTVYRGERADAQYQRVVAIKVLHQVVMHPRLRSRLNSERQILASLDHPSIARLIDSGTLADGTPYLLMEYVDGETLLEFCDQHELGLQARIELLIKVCAAVDFAHRNLVVHRDIKPANILVQADGTPKLLDFGIAKLLAPEGIAYTLPLTLVQERILTPENAAPEQVLGRPVTTATDIYALGVLLYHLLSGRSPYRLSCYSQLQLERAICVDEPVRPSQMVTAASNGEQEPDADHIAARRGLTPARLAAQLSGDLDAIVAMAMRKEPDRRYSSVQALCDDLARYLHGQPVKARQGDWRYHGAKFFRRNVLWVSVVGAIILALGGVAAVTLRQNHLIALARDTAAQERDRAQQVSTFLVDVFSQADPFTAQGRMPTAKDLLDRGAEQILGNANLQPEVRAELLESIGLAYRRQGLTDQAVALFDQALATRREQRPVDKRRIAAALANLAQALTEGGHLGAAEDDLNQALMISRAGSDPNQTADILVQIGHLVLDGQSQPERAFKFFQEALGIYQVASHDPLQISATLNGMGASAGWIGDYQRAAGYQRRALALLEANISHNHPDYAIAMENFAVTLIELGDFDEAEKLLGRARDIELVVFGPDNPRIADIEADFGMLYDHRGDSARAIASTQRALEISRQRLGPNHYFIGYYFESLAILDLKVGDLRAAEANVREALEIYAKSLPARHLYVASARRLLAEIELKRGVLGAAEAEATAAAAMTAELAGPANWRTARADSTLGWILIARGADQGGPMLAAAFDRLRATVGLKDEATRKAGARLLDYYRSRHLDEDAQRLSAALAGN
jgi:serine/threonine protein kinase/tetratricopeptide (TPR) repeat protein